jgi:hypothetical protein
MVATAVIAKLNGRLCSHRSTTGYRDRDASAVMWFARYKEVHPHKAL